MENRTEVVTITGQQVQRLTYKGMDVLSLPQIDQIHGRPSGTARRNFHLNREYFKEGEHYFKTGCVRLTYAPKKGGGDKGESYFFTKDGYCMLVKTFRDKKSWQVQAELVRSYFSRHQVAQPAPAPVRPEPQVNTAPVLKYLLFDKTNLRIFNLPGLGECFVARELDAATGNCMAVLQCLKSRNPAAAKLIHKIDPRESLRGLFEKSARHVNMVRVLDAAALLHIKKPSAAITRLGRLIAEYSVGLARTYSLVENSVTNQPLIPFQA